MGARAMVSLVAAGLAATDFGSPHGVTKQDSYVRDLWHITYYFAIPLGALVIGLIVWCLLRYRHRPGDDRAPAQFQYHIPIEVSYIIIPLVIVSIIFGFMYNAENKIDAVSKHPDVKILVEGFQWGWRFTYPNGHQEVGSIANEPSINDLADLPVLYMPADETVQLKLVTDDVNHTFYVPEFLFQRDLIAGINNVVDFNVQKTGRFLGECNTLCGTYHAYMRFMVDVMAPGEFSSWYAGQAPGSITQAGSTH
jgi:cytochrome c oxidase subunit II